MTGVTEARYRASVNLHEAPLRYLLPAHVSFCLADGRAVFLDVRRDLYFCLGRPANAAFRALMEEAAISEAAATALLNAGVVTCDGGRRIAPTRVEPAERSAIEHFARDRRDADVRFLAVARLAAMTWIRLRAFSLERVLAWARSNADRVSDENLDAEACMGLAAAFNRTRRSLPLKPHCLLDSLILHDFLCRCGLRSDLVLGVRLQPFAAHAWVQVADVVLNETLDGARVHNPILVI